MTTDDGRKAASASLIASPVNKPMNAPSGILSTANIPGVLLDTQTESVGELTPARILRLLYSDGNIGASADNQNERNSQPSLSLFADTHSVHAAGITGTRWRALENRESVIL